MFVIYRRDPEEGDPQGEDFDGHTVSIVEKLDPDMYVVCSRNFVHHESGLPWTYDTNTGEALRNWTASSSELENFNGDDLEIGKCKARYL